MGLQGIPAAPFKPQGPIRPERSLRRTDMERFTISSVFAGALLGLSSLCLASAWTPGSGVGAPGGAAGRVGGWRLGEPGRYENITIFPLPSGESARPAGAVTPDEALRSGEALLSEPSR